VTVAQQQLNLAQGFSAVIMLSLIGLVAPPHRSMAATARDLLARAGGRKINASAGARSTW